MAGIGVLVAWLGYSLAYFGIDQIRGGNNGLLSLMIPGKYTNQPNDSGVSTPGTPIASSNTVNAGNPGNANPISSTSAPKGAPPGTYGVDPNGTIYVKQGGSWIIYTTPNGQRQYAV